MIILLYLVRLAGSNSSSNDVKRGGIGSGGVAMPINDNDIESTTRVPAITPPIPEEETTAGKENNKINGWKCSVSRWLIKTLLKKILLDSC